MIIWMTLCTRRAISLCNCIIKRCSPHFLGGYNSLAGSILQTEFNNGSIYNSCFADFSTISRNKLLPLRNLSQTDLCSKLENEVKDHRVREAWQIFKLYKKLHGYPEISVMGKLITESSYSFDRQCLQKACDLVLQHSKPKSVFLRLEIVAKLALSLARTQMPIPASKILRLMLEKGSLPPMNILRLIILHMVKSDVGTYITSNFLIEICDSNKTMPDTMIFNLVLDACLRFKSFLKAQDLVDLMALSGVVADSNSLALIAQIHERNGRRYELVKYKDHVDRVSTPFVRQYKQFYDSLLSLHFKFDDIDAAAELVGDIYITRDIKDELKPHFVPIGSSHLKSGLKIIVSTEKGDDFCSFSIQKKEAYVVLRKEKLGVSNLALAKFVHRFRKNKRIEDLSKILYSIQEPTKLLDLIKGCICVGWLETAHDFLDDFESFGCTIDSSAYFALLEAYNKRGMAKEAKALQKQMEKRGALVSNSSSISTNSDMTELLKQEIERTPIPPILYEVNSSIYFFSKAKMMEDAWKTYRRMQEMHIQPNEQTFAALVSGFSSLQMYRDVTILWGDIKRIEKLEISRDLCELLVVSFIRGGYFERVMEVIKFMEENNMYADKLMYRWEYRKLHRNLYRSLRASEASSEAQRKRLEFVVEFRRWLLS